MITTSATDSGFAVRWIKLPKINAKAIVLIAMAVLLPILVASSLPHAGPLTQSLTILSTRRQIPQVTTGDKHLEYHMLHRIVKEQKLPCPPTRTFGKNLIRPPLRDFISVRLCLGKPESQGN
jgi:hypothetical protein